MSESLLTDLFGGEVSKKVPSVKEELDSQAVSHTEVDAAVQALKEVLIEAVRDRVKGLDLCEKDRKTVLREITKALRE